MSEEKKAPPAGSQFFKFCEALGIDPYGPRVTKLGGAVRVVHFSMGEAVKNPDAKPGDFPFAQVYKGRELTFWFRDDGSFSCEMIPGWMQTISVTMFNLLHQAEAALRAMQTDLAPELVKLLETIDRVRRESIAGRTP